MSDGFVPLHAPLDVDSYPVAATLSILIGLAFTVGFFLSVSGVLDAHLTGMSLGR
jgi:hypothetical protein